MLRSIKEIRYDLGLIQKTLLEAKAKESRLVLELGQAIAEENKLVKERNITGVMVRQNSLFITVGDPCEIGKN
jgi:hypothetical protein